MWLSVQCDAPVSRSTGGRKATDKKAVGVCVVVIHVDSCGGAVVQGPEVNLRGFWTGPAHRAASQSAGASPTHVHECH